MPRTFTNDELLRLTHAQFTLLSPADQEAFNSQLDNLWNVVALHMKRDNDLLDAIESCVGPRP